MALAGQALINSRSRGFSLNKGIPAALPKPKAPSLENYIPLQDQLNFKTKSISGNDYKAIVDRALQSAPGGSAVQKQLVLQEADAINRINEENQKAVDQQRQIAQLQADIKASNHPTTTSQDHMDLYNFWLDQANQAQQQGDAVYMAKALDKAANERQLAASTGESEAKKFQATQGKQALTNINKVSNDAQQSLRSTLETAKAAYQSGKIDGATYDKLVGSAYVTYAQSLQGINNYLGQLQANGIDTLGSTSIEDLLTKYDGLLNGTVDANGNVVHGAVQLVSDYVSRVTNAGNYRDVLVIGKNGVPSLQRQLNDGSPMVQDEQGRWLPLNVVKDKNGQFVYTVQTVDKNGNIITRTSQPQKTALDAINGATPTFLDQNGKPIIEQNGRISLISGTQAQYKPTGFAANPIVRNIGNALSNFVTSPLGQFGLKNLTFNATEPLTGINQGVGNVLGSLGNSISNILYGQKSAPTDFSIKNVGGISTAVPKLGSPTNLQGSSQSSTPIASWLTPQGAAQVNSQPLNVPNSPELQKALNDLNTPIPDLVKIPNFAPIPQVIYPAKSPSLTNLGSLNVNNPQPSLTRNISVPSGTGLATPVNLGNISSSGSQSSNQGLNGLISGVGNFLGGAAKSIGNFFGR